jgi:hypothetical protein
MNIDYKNIFYSDQKYNALFLLESSIFENMVTIYAELDNHNKKDDLVKEKELLEMLFKINSKYGNYQFCTDHFHNRYDGTMLEEKVKLCESNLKNLFSALFDKINLLIDDFMSIVEYNPNRVSFNNRTSVFLIAYATELKQFWESFNEKFMEDLFSKDIEDKVFSEGFMKEKLKFVAVATAKGVWAKGPIKF